jgi:hypothetical protein
MPQRDLIRSADELLTSYRLDVTSGHAQQFGSELTNVFVELESHAT